MPTGNLSLCTQSTSSTLTSHPPMGSCRLPRSIWIYSPKSTQQQMWREIVSSKRQGRPRPNQQALIGQLSLLPADDARLWFPRMANLPKQHQYHLNRHHTLQPTHSRHNRERHLTPQSILCRNKLRLRCDHRMRQQAQRLVTPTLLLAINHPSRLYPNQVTAASTRLHSKTQSHLRHATSPTLHPLYLQLTEAIFQHGTTRQTLAHQSQRHAAVLQ